MKESDVSGEERKSVNSTLKSLGKCSGIVMCVECLYKICQHRFKVISVHTVQRCFFFSSSHTQLLRDRTMNSWISLWLGVCQPVGQREKRTRVLARPGP